MKKYVFFHKVIFSAAMLFLVSVGIAQESDSIQKTLDISGTINANSNGFSLVPTFSLGKPAVQSGFNISGNGRFSFHPQFWYSMLDYKPWSLILIWRYKLIDKDQFDLYLGTHAPGINFQSASVTEDNVAKEVIKARRFYPALELTSNYHLKENISIGLYGILGSGIEEEISSTNTFLSFRANFRKIPINSNFHIKLNPQVYYLRIDDKDGIYTAGGLTLAHKSWPISISSMFNRELFSRIEVSKFEWNVGISYSFAKSYIERE